MGEDSDGGIPNTKISDVSINKRCLSVCLYIFITQSFSVCMSMRVSVSSDVRPPRFGVISCILILTLVLILVLYLWSHLRGTTHSFPELYLAKSVLYFLPFSLLDLSQRFWHRRVCEFIYHFISYLQHHYKRAASWKLCRRHLLAKCRRMFFEISQKSYQLISNKIK